MPTERQTDYAQTMSIQTDIQMDRQTDRQTDRHTHTYPVINFK